MSINHYHHNEKFLKIGYWASALDAASYRSTDELYDEHSGRTYARDNNVGICRYSTIYLPESTPEAFADRQYLWNAAMKAEEKKDGTYKAKAQFAHEVEFSLSNKLSYEDAIKVCDEYGQRLASQGMIADLSLHWKDENHHVHIMVPTRAIDMETGQFSKTKTKKVKLESGKSRCVNLTPWFDAEHLQERRRWTAEIQNQYLEKEDQISEKSFKDQGLDITPKPHLLRSDWEAMKKYKEDPKQVLHVTNKETFQQAIYMDKIRDLQDKIDAIAEEKTADDLEQKLHDIAIKTLPDTVQWHPLDCDDINEYGEYNLLVSEAWMRKYNRYLEKAGMDEYKVDSPLGVCQRLAPDCEINNLDTYWAKAEIVMPNKDVKKAMEKAFKIQQEKAKIKNTPAPVPVTPTKKTTPVQTAHSQIGSVIAAGIEDLGGRSGGQAVSEQVVDDMTKNMSKMTAVIIRVLADALKQMTKEIKKNLQSIKAPIKDIKPIKEEKPKQKEEPKAPKPKEEPKKQAPQKPKQEPAKPISMDMDARLKDALTRAQETKVDKKKPTDNGKKDDNGNKDSQGSDHDER